MAGRNYVQTVLGCGNVKEEEHDVKNEKEEAKEGKGASSHQEEQVSVHILGHEKSRKTHVPDAERCRRKETWRKKR